MRFVIKYIHFANIVYNSYYTALISYAIDVTFSIENNMPPQKAAVTINL